MSWLKELFTINIHVHVHTSGAGGCSFFTMLQNIDKKVDRLMAASKELKDLCREIDTATDAVAVILTDLRDRVKTSMTQAEVDEIKAELSARVEELKGIAKNPDEPVPE